MKDSARQNAARGTLFPWRTSHVRAPTRFTQRISRREGIAWESGESVRLSGAQYGSDARAAVAIDDMAFRTRFCKLRTRGRGFRNLPGAPI